MYLVRHYTMKVSKQQYVFCAVFITMICMLEMKAARASLQWLCVISAKRNNTTEDGEQEDEGTFKQKILERMESVTGVDSRYINRRE